MGLELSAANRRQLYIPDGFAHGFAVLGERALVSYKVTAPYRGDAELAVRWNDPALAIAWPLAGAPVLSPRDAAAPALGEIAAERLPRFDAAPAAAAGHA